MKKITHILNTYNVDSKRGFLPANDPLTELPKAYKAWDDLAKNLTSYINAGVVREKIDALPLIKNPHFEQAQEWERAMLLLSTFGHAYVHCPPNPSDYIPATVSIPWLKVAQYLGRPPVLAHYSLVVNNWRRLDMKKPVRLDNLATICQFHGGIDESWFYLVTVEIEQVGAKAIPLVLQVMELAANDSFEKAVVYLEEVQQILSQIVQSLRKMYLHCDPYVFFLRVRPFASSFEQIKYLGTDLPPQNLHGASAAQSSLLQFFDAAFGIGYKNEYAKNYLLSMRNHMPIPHAEFLRFIEKTTTLSKDISKNKALNLVYKKCVEQLIEFRNEHLKIVALYIMKQAKATGASSKGTGGTNPMVFLKSVRNRNEEYR